MDRNFTYTMIHLKGFFTVLFLLIILIACTSRKTQLEWDVSFGGIGSQSSPRTLDVNNDGTLDIVIGAGKNEFDKSNQGILAINGKSGEILWQQASLDQVFGSPTFIDVTNDGVKDVFIGGRSHQLYALNGATGEVIWQYEYVFENHPKLKHAKFNFYSGVPVPDQDGDGVKDLLYSNGGNVLVGPHIEEGREPGLLMIFSTKTGAVLGADTMPDGRETYMSPVVYQVPGVSEPYIVFASGGETLNGNLYLTTVSDLMRNDLSQAKILAREDGHGFIAPPSLADINQDGILDIIAISHASTIFAIDGKDYSQLWKNHFPNTETSNSCAVGYFTSDDIPDFFTFVSEGEWPNNTKTYQILFDGRDGSIAYLDSMGCTGFSSPVTYDLNKDGIEEAIISINEWDCRAGFAEKVDKENTITNKLIAINFQDGKVIPIDQLSRFKNIFSTPVLGDLDSDGYLDIVHFQYYHHSAYINVFMGMRAKRISTNIAYTSKSYWSAYMGSDGDGIFRNAVER